ncbi:MAG: hypothetical protein KUG56_00365 [Kordiimonadaceae bacterium]|nr:hypothetical protein [Kordiimonadaceae bacterium]
MTNHPRPTADMFGRQFLEQSMAIPVTEHQKAGPPQAISIRLKYFLFGYIRIAFSDTKGQEQCIMLDDPFDGIEHLIEFVQRIKSGKSTRYAVYNNNDPHGVVVSLCDGSENCLIQLYDVYHDADLLLWEAYCQTNNLVEQLQATIGNILSDKRLIPFYLHTSIVDDPHWGPLFDEIEGTAEREWAKRYPKRQWKSLTWEEQAEFKLSLCAETFEPVEWELQYVDKLKFLSLI